jgi:hypothetical protein
MFDRGMCVFCESLATQPCDGLRVATTRIDDALCRLVLLVRMLCYRRWEIGDSRLVSLIAMGRDSDLHAVVVVYRFMRQSCREDRNQGKIGTTDRPTRRIPFVLPHLTHPCTMPASPSVGLSRSISVCCVQIGIA